MSISHWETQLKDLYNLNVTLTALNSEYDLNYLAQNTAGPEVILKVMRPEL